MHVLVIAPFDSGLEYIPAAKKLGMRVSVIAGVHESLAIPEAYAKQADHVEVAPDQEAATFIRLAQDIHKTNPIDAVVPGIEFYVDVTAHVARALGVRGLDPDKVGAVLNKGLMRQALADAQLRTPRFARVTSAVDLEQAVQDVGFPVVVKPTRMAASIGVVRADNPVELLAAYEDIQADTDGVVGFAPGSEVLIEELLEGTEYIADGYVTSDGTITVCEFSRPELGPQPHFQETGHTTYLPEDLPGAEAIIAYITAVVKAVGITIGAFHSELILTKDGPVLVEIAARLCGGRLPELTEMVTGIDVTACSLAASAGLPMPEPTAPRARVAALQCITAPELGGQTYRALEGLEELRALPEVDEATVLLRPGTILPKGEDGRGLIAEIFYHADSMVAAEAFREKILQTVRVVS